VLASRFNDSKRELYNVQYCTLVLYVCLHGLALNALLLTVVLFLPPCGAAAAAGRCLRKGRGERPGGAPQEQQQGEEQQTSGGFPFRPLCINPGRLTKGPSGGTFCQVSVYSSESEGFHEHVQVEVMRI